MVRGSKLILRDIREFISPIDGGRCERMFLSIVDQLELAKAKNEKLKRRLGK